MSSSCRAFRRRIAARSGRVVKDSAFLGSRVLDRPRDQRPLGKLVLADHEKVDGQQHPVEGPPEPDHLLEAVRDWPALENLIQAV